MLVELIAGQPNGRPPSRGPVNKDQPEGYNYGSETFDMYLFLDDVNNFISLVFSSSSFTSKSGLFMKNIPLGQQNTLVTDIRRAIAPKTFLVLWVTTESRDINRMGRRMIS